jgi:tetratricopeptide (TPR) repeat protein
MKKHRRMAISDIGCDLSRPDKYRLTSRGAIYRALLSSLMIILTLAYAAPAFEIPPDHKSIADPVIKEIIECRFDNAMRLSDAALAGDGKNAMAAVLHLVAVGMRDVDAELMIDSAAFTRSFDRARLAVDDYEKANGQSSYATTLRGFTLVIHASFHLKNKSYMSAAGTGMDAIKLMKEARQADPQNTEVNFFLGLYDFALADLKKKLWWIMFWYPGNKQSGIKQLEECAKTAKLTNTAAELALSDIYLQEKQPQKSLEIIQRLKNGLPESRFLLWAQVKYYEDQKQFKEAAEHYGILADSYEADKYGWYNGAVTRNKQAHLYNKMGDNDAAIKACRHLLERGGSDKRIRSIIKDTEKLLEKLEKSR